MRIAYLDCFSGISGDMFLGALVDLGLPLDELGQELLKLGLEGFEISSRPVTRRGIQGIKVDILLTVDQPHRNLKDILKIIHGSRLDDTIKEDAKNVFTLLASAEGKVHGCPPETIHFHEVGAVDAIVDIVGALIGIKRLGIEKIFCSPLNLGSGLVTCAHGVMPVPAPATAALLVDVPVYAEGPAVELVTPTGAVLVKYLSAGFGPVPAMTLKSLGYGAGDRDTERPNLLRVMIGECIFPKARGRVGRFAWSY